MKFLAPQWLWVLFLIPVLYGVVLWDEKKRNNKFSEMIHQKLWPMISPERDPRHRLRKAAVWLGAFGFLILALARPQWGSHEETVYVSGLDMVIVLDVSSSMEVEDVVPSRLLKAKHMIRSIMNQLDGDRVGIVAFAGSSFFACPLTTDLSYVSDVVETLDPKLIRNQGTDISIGLETAYRALVGGAEQKGTPQEGGAPSHVIVLISDGEDHEAQAVQVAAKIKKAGAKFYALGIGTEKGGPIPVKDDGGNRHGYKRDESGQTVLSTFHPQALLEIASSAGGKYWNVTDSESEVGELLKDVGAMDRTDFAERKYTVYEERFQIPLIIAIALIFLELSLPARKLLTCLILFFGSMGIAHAESILKKTAPLDAYLENEKGLKAYQEGRIEEAQKNFAIAQAHDPSLPELEFNQGVAEFQRGEVEKSLESFSKSAELAKAKENPGLLGKSMYNLGNSYVKKGDIANAARSYIGAIEAARQAKNQTLEDESRKNLQLMLNEVKKQKQQKQEQDQQKQEQKQQENKEKQDQQNNSQSQKSDSKPDKEKEEKDDPGKSQDKSQNKGQEKNPDKNQDKDQNKNEEKKGQQKQYQSAPKQQFKSQKMTQEDVDRVMSELANKEKELQLQDKIQERFKAKNAKQKNSSKDW